MAYRSDNQGPPSFLLFLFIGLCMLIGSGIYGVQAIRYSAGGRAVQGRITDCYTEPKHGGKCYYEFQVAGKTYSGVTGMYSEGSPVTVSYLDSDPDNNDLSTPQWFPTGTILLVLGLAALGYCGKLLMSNDDLMAD